MKTPEQITFFASLPDLQSAITFSGGRGQGARLKLDLPESEQDAVLLLAYHGRGRLLKVTVEFADETEQETTRVPARIDLRRAGVRRDQPAGE